MQDIAEKLVGPEFIVRNVNTVFIPGLALGIASLVIAAQNPDITCDGTMIPLPTWLNVYGGTALGMCGVLAIAIALLTCGVPIGMYTYAGIGIFHHIFMIAWNVVGAVSLFRDSTDCKDAVYSIWAMTLAVLIVQWIGFASNCCRRNRATDDD